MESRVSCPTNGRPRCCSARTMVVVTTVVVLLAFAQPMALGAQGVATKEDPAQYWQKNVDDLLASYRAKGEPVTWQDVLAAREKLPPDQNSAIAFEKAFEELRSVEIDHDVDGWVNDRGVDFGKDCSPQSLKLCLRYLDRFKGPFADLEKAGRIAHGVYPLPNDPSRLYETMGYLTGARGAAYRLSLAAHFDVQQGKGAEAATKLLTIGRVSDSLGECSYMTANLTKVSVQDRLTGGLENCLSIGTIPSEDLAKIGAELTLEETETNLRHAFYGERAIVVDAFRKGPMAEIFENFSAANVPDSVKRWMALPGQKDSEEWHACVALDHMMQIAALPPREVPAAIASMPMKEDPSAEALIGPGLLARKLLPVYRKAFQNEVNGVAGLRVARAAIAAERYRMDHGKWPESLEGTVPAFMETVPIDPYSGREVLYRRTSDGVVVYSVGPNGRDDGGVGLARTAGNVYDFLDLPFRLLDADKRPLRTTTFREEPKTLGILEKLGMTEADMIKAGLTKEEIQELKDEERAQRELEQKLTQNPYQFLQGTRQ